MSPWSGAQADQHLAGPDSAPLPRDRWKHLTLAQRRREAPKRLMPQLLDAPAPLPPIAYRYTEITPQLYAEAQGHQIEAAQRTDHNTPSPGKQPRAPGPPGSLRADPRSHRVRVAPGRPAAGRGGGGSCSAGASGRPGTRQHRPRLAPPVKGPGASAPSAGVIQRLQRAGSATEGSRQPQRGPV